METEVYQDLGSLTRRQRSTVFEYLLGKWLYEGLENDEELQNLWMLLNYIFENASTEDFLGWTQMGLLHYMEILAKFCQPNALPRSGNKWLPLERSFIYKLPTPRRYYSLKLDPNVQRWYLSIGTRVKTKRKYPPRRFIGVGYKDKGTLRFSHLDGTPSWSEAFSLTKEEVPVVVSNHSFTGIRDPSYMENLLLLIGSRAGNCIVL